MSISCKISNMNTTKRIPFLFLVETEENVSGYGEVKLYPILPQAVL